LQDLIWTFVQFELLPNDGHKHVNADGDPDLSLHRVRRCTVECFDSQILFDPFKEQLYLPTTFIYPRNYKRWQEKVIAQKNKPFLCFGIAKADAAQGNRVGFRRLGTGEDDRLVAAQPRGLVDRSITTPTVVHVPFGAGSEERHVASKSMQPGEVDVTAILDVLPRQPRSAQILTTDSVQQQPIAAPEGSEIDHGIHRNTRKRESESTSPFRVLPCVPWLPVCDDPSCRGNKKIRGLGD